MSDESAEKDPPKVPKKEVDGAPVELLNIKVLGHDSSVIQFRIKKHTPFAKLMRIYCEKMRLSQSTVRFLFDGERVTQEDTPGGKGMEEGDTLEVMTLQEGGEGCVRLIAEALHQ